jgi:regulator of protease activity HflC (stomatin/prohibitin superfamily)
MFDKLITLIQQFLKELLPVFVVDQWDEALMLRGGKFLEVYKPGLYFKIPFLDSIWYCTVITQSIDIPPQSITTADGKNVVVKGIIRFSVVDIKTFLLTITQPADVLTDTTGGMIREIIEDTRWEGIIDIDKKLTTEVGKFVKKWGIKVEKVTLTDLQIADSIRVIQDATHQAKIVPLKDTVYDN